MGRRHFKRKRIGVNQGFQTKSIIDRLIAIFLIILFFMGILYGTLIYQDYNDRLDLSSIVNRMVERNQNPLQPDFSNLLSSILQEFSFFFLLWFLSLTIIGIIVVVFSIFFYGFTIGFAFTFFIQEYGSKGFTIGILHTFPKNVILLPYSFYFSLRSIQDGMKLFLSAYRDRNQMAFRHHFARSLQLLTFSIGIVVLYALIDAITAHWISERLRRLL